MDKSNLRLRAKQIRDNISTDRRLSDAQDLKNSCVQFLNDTNYKGLLGVYYPIGSEIHPPHEILDYSLALPVVRNKTTLEFYPWSIDKPLAKKEFNIPIPDTRGLEVVYPNCLIVPLLSCDETGNRLGYGAGHYDRYYASRDNKPIMVGVCFEEQISKDLLPFEPHDVKLNFIVTPKRIIKIK